MRGMQQLSQPWSQVTTHMRGHHSATHAYAWKDTSSRSESRLERSKRDPFSDKFVRATHMRRKQVYAWPSTSSITFGRDQARQASRLDAARTSRGNKAHAYAWTLAYHSRICVGHEDRI
ncbi:hypothetical protein PIB30_109477 [Stylosanthes scabra]|uniref:Uncharacterized protein n=1 Tax=Stylosanthes scabra TaxID=79078 RepID=A0ABU6XYR8_9FABA|nr:hypothetical protein [Stylosanthes scabra]